MTFEKLKHGHFLIRLFLFGRYDTLNINNQNETKIIKQALEELTAFKYKGNYLLEQETRFYTSNGLAFRLTFNKAINKDQLRADYLDFLNKKDNGNFANLGYVTNGIRKDDKVREQVLSIFVHLLNCKEPFPELETVALDLSVVVNRKRSLNRIKAHLLKFTEYTLINHDKGYKIVRKQY